MSDTSTASQIEALRDLISSQGWQIYTQMVKQEIETDFADHVTRALDNQTSEIALDKMRQVAVVRKAGYHWLKMPEEKLQALTNTVEHAQDRKVNQAVGRRPSGL